MGMMPQFIFRAYDYACARDGVAIRFLMDPKADLGDDSIAFHIALRDSPQPSFTHPHTISSASPLLSAVTWFVTLGRFPPCTHVAPLQPPTT